MEDTTAGVGPHHKPWPKDDHFDPLLLEKGDHRNVTDIYRYWHVDAIKADLDKSRHLLHIAIENWQHDFNIGSIVRTANAFDVSTIHIIGRRHWNRRGAMVTDRYMTILHHASVNDFKSSVKDKVIVVVDNIPGAVPLNKTQLPKDAVLVFGGEGPGVSQDIWAIADLRVMIEQFGSTRSINVGVAAGIVMYAWLQYHALD